MFPIYDNDLSQLILDFPWAPQVLDQQCFLISDGTKKFRKFCTKPAQVW